MAAAFMATASALSPPNALTSRGEAAGLSSGHAFQTTSLVQQGPATRKAHRMVAARASPARASPVAKKSKAAARREVLASILAAGASLGFGGRAVADPIQDAKTAVVDIVKGKAIDSAKGAFADPIENVKTQAVDTVTTKAADSAKQIVDDKVVPSDAGPVVGPIVEEAKKKVLGSIDNIFGKGKPPPFKFTPTSGPGSTKIQQSFGNLGYGVKK